ncbi:MAG: CPXCG motif-containing cysteine-rich protein [Gammaproteobacteria bacterium]|nr:CPXCG motif-containing cysteine-rich protein [Gammaproteobacteria bacterium]MCW8993474.1 CPXCG motif-containing cysteine-rich protein [Gammaproteobacteria bacterium]
MLQTRLGDCPYCGEPIELVLDPGLAEQEYVEDCFVCCRPIVVRVTTGEEGDMSLSLRREDDV